MSTSGAPSAGLSPEERAERAASFGQAAAHYERYRPGPPEAAVAWLIPRRVGTVVDVGAGTSCNPARSVAERNALASSAVKVARSVG